ncbi:hypothetical protein C2I18_00725 [Paenibacillus sp. PK3_47]|uniref:hypothetical protein n=1 Tax=Paenibacillus sp. PK3_47 TaxID=2072642 RepID=UPI00201D45DB|nr:hypothetical protein [Paenibacillus sp. PK3_47]UQZ32202.1 hypothetical protein C2I18_00725 [Paenibacillus sp. PK3_47]
MRSDGYRFMLIKFIAAIVSAIVFSLYNSWRVYTPVSERTMDVGYHSFSVLFAFNFVPDFFIFIIMGLILSPLFDSVILKRFSLNGMKGKFIIMTTYLILGVISGAIVTVFYLKTEFISYYILVSTTAAMIFLFFQIVIYHLMYFGQKRES